jgi:tetratricopeptide (TPR) repeat protein
MHRPKIDQLLTEARSALDRQDTPLAVTRLDAILRRDPAHGLARLYLGQIARDAGDLDKALSHWAAVDDQPAKTGVMARYFQGTVLMELHRAREAEANLRRSTELNPDYLPPHERLVELYVSHMRRDETRRELSHVGRLRPWKIDELVMYTVAGERVTPVDEGIGLMRAFLKVDPDDLTSGLALARYFSAGDRTDDALQLLRRLAIRFSDDERIAAQEVEELLRKRDLAAVSLVLAKYPLTSRSDVSFWHSYGKYWFEKGDWNKAADCLRVVVARDPENLPAAYQFGTALARGGHLDQAKSHLARSELLDKLQREALRIPRRDRRQAGALLPIVLETARLLVEVERFAEAAWWYDQAAALDSDSVAARSGSERADLLAAAVAGRKPPTVPQPSDSDARRLRVEPEVAPPLSGVSISSAGAGRIVLHDVGQAAGLDFQYFSGQTGFKYLVESMGGGVGVLDFDGDGWPDLYFPDGCRLPYDPNDFSHVDRLYRNRGDGTFEDVTAQSGLGDNRYSQGCAVGDYDNDGDPDLFVVNFGRSVLYRNQGDGTFTDASAEVGIEVDKWSSSAAFADLDRDGNLDLYVVTYVDSLRVCRADDNRITTCDPQNFNAEQDVLYRNLGDGTMADVSAPAGILAPDGKGLGIVTADFDDDGWPDIYVANDGTPNFMFHNLGPGDLRFREEGLVAGVAVSAEGQAQAGMGIACADLNGDGLLDLFVTNFYLESSTLYLNLGGGLFEDHTRDAGLESSTRHTLGFGTQAIDFDCDGWPELIVANGHIDDYRFRNEPWKMPPQLFRNLGGARFKEISHDAGAYFHGEYLGRGVARLDWDRDGLPDAVVVHQDRTVALLQNETLDPGHRLVLELHGIESNRDAIGARLRLTAGGRTQVLEICGGHGFFCSNELRQYVGLGSCDRLEILEIHWPSGRHDRWTDLPIGVRLCIVEGNAPRDSTLGRTASE